MNPTPPPSSRQQLQQLQQQQQRLYDQQRRAQNFLSKQESMPAPAMQNRRVHFADERPMTAAPLTRPIMPDVSLTNTDIIGSSPKMLTDPLTKTKAEHATGETASDAPVSTEMEAIVASLRIICVIALISSVFAIPVEYRTIWGVIIAFALIVSTSSMMHNSLMQNGDINTANAVIKTGTAVFFFGTIIVMLFIAYKIYFMVRQNQQQINSYQQNQMRPSVQQHHQHMMPPMMTTTLPMEIQKKKKNKKKNKMSGEEVRPFGLM